MSVLKILSRLKDLDIEITLVDSQLKITAPKGVLTPSIIAELKDNKTGIIEFLQNHVNTPKYESIPAVEKKEYYSLSSSQKRLYFLQQMNIEGTYYNIPRMIELEGNLEMKKLGKTFRELIERHESLRTSFEMIHQKLAQKIHDNPDFEIEYFSITRDTWTKTFKQEMEPVPLHEISRVIKTFIRPFHLSQAPLMRAGIMKTEEIKYLLVVDMHHIISDRISLEILAKDFMAFYSGKKLPFLLLQYKDYAEWQNSKVQKESRKAQKAYWLNEFPGEIPLLNLSTDYFRPLIQGFEGRTLYFAISPLEVQALKEIALKAGTTTFCVTLALCNILFSKFSSQEDIVMGTLVAGRKHSDLEGIMGMFINTLAIRNYPSREKTFTIFLEEIKTRMVKAFENQDYPFEDLVEELEVSRDASRNPLFDIMFDFQYLEEDTEAATSKTEPREKETYNYESQVSKFDMFWKGIQKANQLTFIIQYYIKLYKPETIRSYMVYFKRILSQVVENPGIKLAKIEMITEDEKKIILYQFNNTSTDYPTNKTIHSLFEEQVQRRPDHRAIIGKSPGTGKTGGTNLVQLTYSELNEKSNRLSHMLHRQGVKPDTIVGLMLARSIEMLVGIFGILKAGGAYLPIDPQYPEERINYLLCDSAAKIVITDRNLTHHPLTVNKIELPPVLQEWLHLPTSSLPVFSAPQPGKLAYIIYTSGSTGKPKGVMVNHCSVVNFLYGIFEAYPMVESHRFLLKTSFLFDVSVSEFFGWYFGGSGLVILEPGGEKDPKIIIDTIARHRVTHINFVPTMFNVFLDILTPVAKTKLAGLQFIFLAGEALSSEPLNKFRRFNNTIRLENLYGPTEGTVYSSKYSLHQWDGVEKIPIGKPLPNIRLFIVDEDGHLIGPGIPGELCIAGEGLARGYLNQPELTAEKFIKIEVKVEVEEDEGGKHEGHEETGIEVGTRGLAPLLYHTGDLARWLPDGNIEYLGRIDQQVKIRGFRIELEEIEVQLLKHGAVKKALVLAKESEKNSAPFLCAYIVPTRKFEMTELRDFLSRKLPQYMVPSYFVPIETLTILPNGKIDKKGLPEPEAHLSHNRQPPETDWQKKLCKIWSEILDIEEEKIGIENNFFELGGTSLHLMMLVSKLYREFRIEIPIAKIYDKPIIKEISTLLVSKKYAEEIYILLNQPKPKKIFCFPPQIGVGLVYTDLALVINDYSLYAFTFIEEEDRFNQYVDIITRLDPMGPYIFFGMSLAGKLTCKTAKAIENSGREVSDIIFADCYYSGQNLKPFTQSYLEEYYEVLEKDLKTTGLNFLKEKVMRKTELYMDFSQRILHLEKINANIHVIMSGDEQQENGTKRAVNWKEVTDKTVECYPGVGRHHLMFKDKALEINAGIFKQILEKIEYQRRR